MAKFTVNTFFFGNGTERFDDIEVLADLDLIKRLNLASGMSGGLTFTTDKNMILVDDDFDFLTNQLLIELPQDLRRGHGKTIELVLANDRFDITLANDMVTFEFGNGVIMTEPLLDTLSMLTVAANRLVQIRAACLT